MDITHVSHSMREQERVPVFATNRDGFLVERERRTATIQVALDLAQTFERPDELTSSAGLAAERYGLGIIAMGVGGSIFKPRTICFRHQPDCLGGEIVHKLYGKSSVRAARSLRAGRPRSQQIT
jgi:hypothetical protein